MTALDEIRNKTTIPLWPDAARLIGLGKTGTYSAAHSGELPFVRKVGSRFIVVVPELLRWLGADPGNENGPAVGAGPSESIERAHEETHG